MDWPGNFYGATKDGIADRASAAEDSPTRTTSEQATSGKMRLIASPKTVRHP